MNERYFVLSQVDLSLFEDFATKEECEDFLTELSEDGKPTSNLTIIKGVELGVKVGVIDD